MELGETELADRVPQSQSASLRLRWKPVRRGVGQDISGLCVLRLWKECGLDGTAMPGVAMSVVRWEQQNILMKGEAGEGEIQQG